MPNDCVMYSKLIWKW